MAAEIGSIKSDSGIAKFFNSDDNAAGIVKHNALLTQLISGLTVGDMQWSVPCIMTS